MIWPTTHGHANKQIVKLPLEMHKIVAIPNIVELCISLLEVDSFWLYFYKNFKIKYDYEYLKLYETLSINDPNCEVQCLYFSLSEELIEAAS